MEKKELQQLIAHLHKELHSTDSVDEGSRELLQQLMKDIEAISSDADSPREHRDSTTSQLEEAALKFESEHPKLSMTLGEIMDALGKLGI